MISSGARTYTRLDIERGRLPGVRVQTGFAERLTLGTSVSGEDLWRGTAILLPQPVLAGEQMSVRSTNVADSKSLDTGVTDVLVHYLDGSLAEKTTPVAMDGTTWVPLSIADAAFVQSLHTIGIGAGDGVAIGNIEIARSSDLARVYSQITAGGNFSLSTQWMVPAGKKLYLMGWHGCEARNKRLIARIRSTDHLGILYPGIFLFKGSIFVNQGCSGSIVSSAEIPASSVVKITGWATVVGADASGAWWGYLIDDGAL